MPNPRIDGIDWRSLQKGDVIPEEHILDYWNTCFPDSEWDKFSMVTVKANIEKLREGINRPIILKEVKGCLLYTSPSPRDSLSSRMPSSA